MTPVWGYAPPPHIPLMTTTIQTHAPSPPVSQDLGLPNNKQDLDELWSITDFGCDGAVIDWSGPSLEALKALRGDLEYNVTTDVGHFGQEQQWRGAVPVWPTGEFVSLGRVGPSDSGNPFLVLFKRNTDGKEFNNHLADEVNASVLGMVQAVKEFTSRGSGEPALKCRLHMKPRAHTVYESFPRKLSGWPRSTIPPLPPLPALPARPPTADSRRELLGGVPSTALARFIRGAIAVGGWIRTVHVDSKLDWEDTHLLRAAVMAGAPGIRIDAALQVPIRDDGIEVFLKRPDPSPFVGSVRWFETFSPEYLMWKWHRNPDDEERISEIEDLLTALGLGERAGEGGLTGRGAYAAADLVAQLRGGRRPILAEMAILKQSHFMDEKTYVGVHHWTSPLLKSTLGDRIPAGQLDMKDPAVRHLQRRMEEARDVLEHITTEFQDPTVVAQVCMRHEATMVNLSAASLRLGEGLSPEEIWDRTLLFIKSSLFISYV